MRQGRNPIGRRVMYGAVCGVGIVAALWVLWGPILRVALDGALVRCLKDYFAPDQYSVLGLARNVQDGLSAYADPYSGDAPSLYPAGYYWVLGTVARITGTTVVWAWNAIGFAVSCLLVGLSAAWAVFLAKGSRAWVLAGAPFLLGTLYWWTGDGVAYYEGFAQLWPPFASLYSPGAENPAILLAGASLLLVAAALRASGRRRMLLASLAGVAAGLTLHAHLNIALFLFVTLLFLALADQFLEYAGRRRRQIIVLTGLAALALSVSAPESGFTVRIGVFALLTVLLIASNAGWLRSRIRILAPLVITAAAASLPLSIALAREALSGTGYLYDRQQSVTRVDVDLGIVPILVWWLPLWALVAAVVWWLAASGRRRAPWLAVVVALLGSTLVLTLAGRLGAAGLEWHRFLIYGTFLLAMVCMPGLWLMLSAGPRRWQYVGVPVVGLLMLTLPATAAFVRAQQSAVACAPPNEFEAFQAIGQAAGPNRVILLDRCFVPGTVRVYAGVRIKYLSLGIMSPPRVALVRRTLAGIGNRELPSDGDLRRIGVTSVLTNSQCGGLAPSYLRRRFGPPVATVPLRDARALGLNGPLTYELFDVPGPGPR